MGFSIFDLCRVLLLVLNAMAILNERRFLIKHNIVPPGGAIASPTVSASSSSSASGGGFGDLDFGQGAAASSGNSNSGVEPVAVKQQIGQLLFSVRLLLRWPLVIANAVMIVLTVVFG